MKPAATTRSLSTMHELVADVIGWGLVAAIVLVPASFAIVMVVRMVSHRPVESKYDADGGGLAGGFSSGLDAVFSPSAHEAGVERDRQTARTAPAPSPGDPPGKISDGSIRIEL